MADRFPAFDRKGLYYRPPVAAQKAPPMSYVDAMLICIFSLIAVGIGLAIILVGGLVLYAIVSAIL